MTWRVVIVDDEPPARARIRRFLADEADFTVVAEAEDVDSAVLAVQGHSPQLLLLDIQLGTRSGFEVVERLAGTDLPLVVFATAYHEHAVRAFEVQALDYLLKPFDRARFTASLARVRERLAAADLGDVEERIRRVLQAVGTPRQYAERLLIKDGERSFFVPVDDVLRVAAAGNYVELYTQGRMHLLRETLSAVAAKLDPGRFLRVHRSHIVRVDCIREFRPWFHGDYQLVLVDGTELALSRRYKALLPAGIREAL